MTTDPAPIALFAYKRLDHLRRVVDSLHSNPLAETSDLEIFCDAARTPSDEAAVQEVRRFVSTISGFRTLTIHERDQNLGLAQSLTQGVTTMLRKRDRTIVLEDDIVVSPFFLQFMNDALDLYAADPRVASVQGYCYPVASTLPTTFFLRGADCWGWATWRRAWQLYRDDAAQLYKELVSSNLVADFDYHGAFRFSKALEQQAKGATNSWAIRWCASAFLANTLSLYPGRSLTQNIGFDGSGDNGGLVSDYDTELTEVPIPVEEVEVEPSLSAAASFEDFFRTCSETMPRWRRVFRAVAKRWQS